MLDLPANIRAALLFSEAGNAPANTQQCSYEEWNLRDNGNMQPDDTEYKKCDAQK